MLCMSISGHLEVFPSQPCISWSPSVAVTVETHMGCICLVVTPHQTISFPSCSCRKTPFLSPFFCFGGTHGKSRAWPLGPPERSSSPSFSLCSGALTGLQSAKDWGGHWGPMADVLTSALMTFGIRWYFAVEGCLCIEGCLAASLTSTYWMPVAPLQLWQPKMSLDITMSTVVVGGAKLRLVENHSRDWIL